MYSIVQLFDKLSDKPSLTDILEVSLELETLHKENKINITTYKILKEKLKEELNK